MPTKEAPAGNQPAERVFLIDSMSHIFRAFFAPMANRVAPLGTSTGQVTQAVYIFTNMLRKLLLDEKPDYIAAIFESGEKTFRHETFADYKANRLAMPEDLASQLPYIIRLCEAFNIPVIKAQGFEADDVIGTLAEKIAENKLQAVIVSNDKDMCQLVSDPYVIGMRTNSQVVKRKEYVPPIEWCDEAWVEKKFGVPASEVVDLLGLMGDSIDNIPGAPGIGSKGAVQIITQFGSIDEALKRWEEVKHKTYRESLHNNPDLIRQSRELARIRIDLDVELDLDQIKARSPDRAAAYELFKELEFSALTREFADAAKATAATADSPLNYQLISSRAELDDLIKSLWDAESVGMAIPDSSPPENPVSPARQEHWGGNGDKKPLDKGEDVADLLCETEYDVPQAVAFSTAEGTSALIDFRTFADGRESAITAVREALSNGLIEKSVHDLKRVVGLLDQLDIKIEGVKDDTFLAAYLLDPNRSKYDLGDLAREAVGVEGIEKGNQGWTDSQWQTAVAADLTARTAKVLHQRILEKKLETIYTEMELPLAPLLFQMERAGLKVDRATLADLSNYLGMELKKL